MIKILYFPRVIINRKALIRKIFSAPQVASQKTPCKWSHSFFNKPLRVVGDPHRLRTHLYSNYDYNAKYFRWKISNVMNMQ